MHSSHQHYKIGIFYILSAWLLFTLMTILVRYASAKASIATILLFQNLIGLISVTPWLAKHGWGLLYTQRFGLIVFRSLVSLSAIALSFLAIQKISLVNTMLFNNSSPLWIPFVIWIWRKIPIDHRLWPGIIGGFIGIALILQPGIDVIQPGSLFAIGAGVLQSINMVALRQLSYTERNHTVLFYYFLVCSLICLPFSIAGWRVLSSTEWLEIGGIGLLFALGQWAFVRAFHFAKAAQLGPFSYAAVVYSVLIDWALYQQTPNLLSWIGIALVCIGGIWAIRFNRV